MWENRGTFGTNEEDLPMTEQEKIDSLFEMWHTIRTMESQGSVLLRGAWRKPRFYTVEFEDEMLRLSQSAARLRVMITEGRAIVHGTKPQNEAYQQEISSGRPK